MSNYKSTKMMLGGIIVFATVTLLGLIYAAFTGQLNITGQAVGRDSKWDIHFENVSTITTSGTAKVLNNHQPTINPNNRIQIQDYEVSLTSPGDSISFTFDVVNDGNYNAKITDIDIGTPQCTSTDTDSATNMCNNLTYSLTYANGSSVTTNDVLYAKDKLLLKVTLQFNDISNPALLPSAGVSIGNLGIEIDFEQEGNALVNDDGTVANNRVYHQGDKITLNNEDYWVIEDSGVGQDYVVALKDEALLYSEVVHYSLDHSANNRSGYGGYPYYASDNCSGSDRTNCKTNYSDSQVKYVIDTWMIDKFKNNELKIVDGYNVRLITKDEYQTIPTTYNWRYNTSYYYWTMSSYGSFSAWYIGNNGVVGNVSVYNWNCVIRPVINVYKSALETN